MNDTTRIAPVVHLAAAAALALVVVAPAHSQQAKGAAKQVTIEGFGAMEVTRITAAVEAVDAKNRIVVLRGPRGNTLASS